ncbi:hypothetical protein PG995_005407 [Apiospora arundinis]
MTTVMYGPAKCPKVLSLERKALGQYLCMLLAHGDFKWYHDRHPTIGTAKCTALHLLRAWETRGGAKTYGTLLRATVYGTHLAPAPEARRETRRDGMAGR